MLDRYQGLRDAIATRHTSGGLVFGADPDTIAALLRERDALRDLLDALPTASIHPAIKAARAAIADGEASNE